MSLRPSVMGSRGIVKHEFVHQVFGFFWVVWKVAGHEEYGLCLIVMHGYSCIGRVGERGVTDQEG